MPNVHNPSKLEVCHAHGELGLICVRAVSCVLCPENETSAHNSCANEHVMDFLSLPGKADAIKKKFGRHDNKSDV